MRARAPPSYAKPRERRRVGLDRYAIAQTPGMLRATRQGTDAAYCEPRIWLRPTVCFPIALALYPTLAGILREIFDLQSPVHLSGRPANTRRLSYPTASLHPCPHTRLLLRLMGGCAASTHYMEIRTGTHGHTDTTAQPPTGQGGDRGAPRHTYANADRSASSGSLRAHRPGAQAPALSASPCGNSSAMNGGRDSKNRLRDARLQT